MKSLSLIFQRRNITFVSLVAGFVALLVAGFVVFKTNQNYLEKAAIENQSNVLIAEIRNLLLVMVDAETAERGYAITHEKEFLQPYEDAQVRLADVYEVLRKDTEDNPEHQARLRKVKELVDEGMTFFSGVIALVKEGNAETAVKRVQSGKGKRIMDEIRIQLGKMEEQENMLLRQLVEKNQEAGRIQNVTMYVSLFLVLALMTIAVYNMVSDIRRRIQVEKELLYLKEKAIEASEMKSHFLANMSHEIRTPLNGIHGMIELMLQTKLTNEQKDYIDTLKESSAALLALINDILDLSKIEAGRLDLEVIPFEPHEVASAVTKVLEYSAQHKNLKIEVHSHKPVPEIVLGDGLRLRQILMNLVGNAIKFSSQGTIQIHISMVDMHASRARLRFEVVDEGVGFDDETKKKLFKTFSQADSSTTRKYGGTGLGLAICRQLVELMGGQIDVFSNPGKGSTFWFEIPYDVSSVRISKAKEAYEQQPLGLDGKAPMVLVVEDHLVNQKVVTNLLNKIGCQYKLANDGFEALEILKSEKFDVILMDCHMPKMDGYETTAIIRSGKDVLQPEIPIIAATANVIKGEKEKCLAAGMNDYISKPMALTELQAKIAKWVAVRPEAAASVSLINPAAIQKMQGLSDEDQNLYQDIVDIFVSTFPQDLSEMRQMLDHSEYLDLAERAHKVKSTCSHLGITPMVEICFFIEHNSFPKNCTALRKGIDDLEGLFQKVSTEFKKMPKAG